MSVGVTCTHKKTDLYVNSHSSLDEKQEREKRKRSDYLNFRVLQKGLCRLRVRVILRTSVKF